MAECDPSMGFGDLEVKLATTPSERDFSGTWAIFLAFGLVWTSFKLCQVRQTRLSTQFSALSTRTPIRTHAVQHALLSAHADWMLISALEIRCYTPDSRG